MKAVIKKIVIMGMLFLMPCICFAQSASESYNKGVALMNKGEYTEAIACFKASMAINKSAANLKKCRTQINKCQRLQKRGGVSSKPVVEVVKTLNVDKILMTFPCDREQTIATAVETTPGNADWTANFATEVNWCRLSKSIDGSTLQVTCSPSNSTILRKAKVNIIYEDLTRSIDVVQQGKEVFLDTNAKFVEFSKKKGGSKKFSVTCESDTLYADKKNWVIEESPKWCNIQVEDNYLITITVDKLTKKDPEFITGRTGDIVLRSQNKKCTIRVDQK